MTLVMPQRPVYKQNCSYLNEQFWPFVFPLEAQLTVAHLNFSFWHIHGNSDSHSGSVGVGCALLLSREFHFRHGRSGREDARLAGDVRIPSVNFILTKCRNKNHYKKQKNQDCSETKSVSVSNRCRELDKNSLIS